MASCRVNIRAFPHSEEPFRGRKLLKVDKFLAREEEEGFAGLRRYSVGVGPLPLLLVGGNSPMHQGRKSPVEKGGEEELPATDQRRQICSLRRSSPVLDADQALWMPIVGLVLLCFGIGFANQSVPLPPRHPNSIAKP
nr:hypothetical protein Iba_scaffold16768CG0060 [Ipomoea batatas]